MQIWLPFESFDSSTSCLDDARLGKQLSDAIKIGRILLSGPKAKDYAHPAVQIWVGSEYWFGSYFHQLRYTISNRWNKNYLNQDTKHGKMHDLAAQYNDKFMGLKTFKWARMGGAFPEWLKEYAPNGENWPDGKSLAHSHQVVLLERNFDHYKEWFTAPPDAEAYAGKVYWPVKVA